MGQASEPYPVPSNSVCSKPSSVCPSFAAAPPPRGPPSRPFPPPTCLSQSVARDEMGAWASRKPPVPSPAPLPTPLFLHPPSSHRASRVPSFWSRFLHESNWSPPCRARSPQASPAGGGRRRPHTDCLARLFRPALRPVPSGPQLGLWSPPPSAVFRERHGSLAALLRDAALSRAASVPPSPFLLGARLPVTQPPTPAPFSLRPRAPRLAAARGRPAPASGSPAPHACRARRRNGACFVSGSPVLSTVPVTRCV